MPDYTNMEHQDQLMVNFSFTCAGYENCLIEFFYGKSNRWFDHVFGCELNFDIVPVLLSGGLRLFENIDTNKI